MRESLRTLGVRRGMGILGKQQTKSKTEAVQDKKIKTKGKVEIHACKTWTTPLNIAFQLFHLLILSTVLNPFPL